MAPPERPRRAPRSPQNRTGAPPRRSGPKPPFKGRDDGPKKPYQRRDDGPKKPYARRDDADRKPYQRREQPPVAQERPAPKKWGNVTRRGARQVLNPTPATEESKAYERRERADRARPEVEEWREPRRVPAPKRAAKAKSTPRPLRAKALPADVAAEVASVAPNARRAPMLQKRLGDAARHIQHGRDKEAAGVLRELAQEVPEAASVRELYGQALYALGRYRMAAKEFEAFIALTGSTDQHPMLADSYRALGQHKKVKELWTELREASPSPEIVAEGRIVAAGSLADQGKLQDAVQMLESAPPVRGRVAERHMRTWYALADLYERSGELSKSRSLFRRVVQHDGEFADAADRLRALG
jgi:tetratricopeptide (TPR) repeat protein